MANYNLVANTRFKPYSFELYIAPLLIYGQEYNKREQQLMDLLDLASTLEMLSLNSRDKAEYDQYKLYTLDIENAASNLSTEGLSAASRLKYLNLKRRYKQEIEPISTLYNQRAKLIDEQRQAKLRDDSLIYDIDFDNISLSQLRENPLMSYTPFSGNKLYAKGVAAGKAYSSRFISTNKDLMRQLGNLYMAILTGVNPEVADLWLLGLLENLDLDTMVDDIASNAQLKGEAVTPGRGHIRRGIAEGLARDIKLQANRDFEDSNARLQRELAELRLLKEGFTKDANGKWVAPELGIGSTSRYLPIEGSDNLIDTKTDLVVTKEGKAIPDGKGGFLTTKGTKEEKSETMESSLIKEPLMFNMEGKIVGGKKEVEDALSSEDYSQISYEDLKNMTIEKDGKTIEDPRFTEVKKAIGNDLPKFYEIYIKEDDAWSGNNAKVIIRPKASNKRENESSIIEQAKNKMD